MLRASSPSPLPMLPYLLQIEFKLRLLAYKLGKLEKLIFNTKNLENNNKYRNEGILANTKNDQKKLRRYAPTKGNQEKTDRIIDIIDIMDTYHGS